MTTPVIYLVLLDSDDQVKKFAKFYKLEDGSSIYDGPPIFGSVDLADPSASTYRGNRTGSPGSLQHGDAYLTFDQWESAIKTGIVGVPFYVDKISVSDVEYEDDRLCRYSLIIDTPTEDLKGPGKAETHITRTGRDIDELVHTVGYFVPPHVVEFLKAIEAAGNYRAEILVGEISYKMYIKPL